MAMVSGSGTLGANVVDGQPARRTDVIQELARLGRVRRAPSPDDSMKWSDALKIQDGWTEADNTNSSAIAVRLRVALAFRERPISWLQRELEKASVGGSKYSNVQRIVAGKGVFGPSVKWIKAAALALDVRAAWLAFGDGGWKHD